jgi:uncharacterized protein
MNQSVADIADALAACPVTDTHEHLRPLESMLPMSLGKLFSDSFVRLALRAADGSPNSYGAALALEIGDEWRFVEPIVRRVRHNSFYRWLSKGLWELYGLGPEDSELDAAVWKHLAAEIPRRYESGSWLADVLDRARVESVVWDPFWHAGTTAVPDQRFRPMLRIDSSLVAFHESAHDFEGNNARSWSETLGVDVRTLDDLEELFIRLLDRNVAAGACSLKLCIAYDRTLRVERTSRRVAERVFGRSPDEVSREDALAFGDYVIRFYLDQARERGLVVQIHTGQARLDSSNPLLLEPLLQDYPDVVFDLLHGGFPWTAETAAIVHAYPNVRLNLVWLPQISSEAAVQALKVWIQVVPDVRHISWGGDARSPEEMYGGLLAGKHVLARAFGDLVDVGYIDTDTAIQGARTILHESGAQIYGLPPGRLEQGETR